MLPTAPDQNSMPALLLAFASALAAISACDGDDARPGTDVGPRPPDIVAETSSSRQCQRNQDCPGHNPSSTCNNVFCTDGRCIQEYDGYPPNGNECYNDASCDDGDPCTADYCRGVAYDCSTGTWCEHWPSSEPTCNSNADAHDATEQGTSDTETEQDDPQDSSDIFVEPDTEADIGPEDGR